MHTKMLLGLLPALLTGYAIVHESGAPAFRAPAPAAGCKADRIEVVRSVDPSTLEALGTRLVEGSVFLSLYEVEQIFRAEACAAGANVVLISSEAYGVPFMGTHAVGTLYRKQERVSMRAEE